MYTYVFKGATSLLSGEEGDATTTAVVAEAAASVACACLTILIKSSRLTVFTVDGSATAPFLISPSNLARVSLRKTHW